MTPTLKDLDMVALKTARPNDGLAAGTRGTIVLVHTTPHTAYEVEFCDASGAMIALVSVLADEVEWIWSVPSKDLGRTNEPD